MKVPSRKRNKSIEGKERIDDILDCKEMLSQISSKLDTIDPSSLDESGLRKFKKFLHSIKSSSSLLDLVSGDSSTTVSIINILFKVFFGKSNEDLRINFKKGYVEDFYIKLDTDTINSIEKRFIKKEEVEGSISFDQAVSNGTTDIGWINSFNGISRKDLKEIYSADAYFPSGKRRRGKGETLSCLAFGGYINNERGADIFIGDNRVEVKSTISASITSEDNLVCSKVKQFVDLSYRITGGRKKEKTYGKRSLAKLIDRIKTNPKKASEFWRRFHQIIGFRTDRNFDNIIPILICYQIEHYSKPENFNMMIIFSENSGGSPDALSLLVKEESFVTTRNIGILRDLNIYFRIYPNKVEIFL